MGLLRRRCSARGHDAPGVADPRRTQAAWAVLAMLPFAALGETVPAPRVTASLDLRALVADATPSFLDGGLGKFRYGESGIAVGRLRLALEQDFGETLRLHLDASHWGDDDRNPLDLTEAYVEWRPIPRSGWRHRLRAGLFYAPSSVENRAEGWESPYAISFSALNSWIAEEIRPIGLEASIDRLGRLSGGDQDVGAFAGVYGWNDPAGVLVVNHGFAIHDRQTLLFGRVGEPAAASVANRQLFHEIDGRAGWYAGMRWRWRDRLEARGMHYDNRGDQVSAKPSIGDLAWLTEFDTVGARAEIGERLTLLAQWLDGYTAVAPPGGHYEWAFDAWFALASTHAGAHTLTLRYDEFRMRNLPNPYTFWTQRDAGHAWTAAWIVGQESSPWRFAAEASRVASRSTDRPALGLAPFARESKLEVSVRYLIRSDRRLE